ncbi:unnamed protein product [Lathyrus oleraceus]
MVLRKRGTEITLFSDFSSRASNIVFLNCDQIMIMTDWRICCWIQRTDICYSKRSWTSRSKLAAGTSIDFDLIIHLWNSSSCLTIKLMASKHDPCFNLLS